MANYDEWLLGDQYLGRIGQGNVNPAAKTPPPATSQRISLTPGWTPDYQQLILQDPAYLSWKSGNDLDLGKAASVRKAALQALAVRYGGLGAMKDEYGDIDQPTLDLAAQNQYSDTAQIQRGYEQGVEGMKRGLAARGMLQSGELPTDSSRPSTRAGPASTTSATSSATPSSPSSTTTSSA